MLKIVGVSNGYYSVLDTDDNTVERVLGTYLYIHKCSGIDIDGCYFIKGGLLTWIDGCVHKVSANLVPETWSDISPLYQVSNLAHIRFKTDNGWINVRRAFSGSRLIVNIGTKTYFVDELVASHFVSNPHFRSEVVHLDGNLRNCNVWNLSYMTEPELRAREAAIRYTSVQQENKTPTKVKEAPISSAQQQPPKFELLGVKPLGVVLIPLELYGRSVLFYDITNKKYVYLDAEGIIRFKAQGGLIESCYYTKTGIRLEIDLREQRGDEEVFLPVRYKTWDKQTYRRYDVSNYGNVRYWDISGVDFHNVEPRETKDGLVVDIKLAHNIQPFPVKVIDLVAHAFMLKPEGAIGVVLSRKHNGVAAGNCAWKFSDGSKLDDEGLQSSLSGVVCYNSQGNDFLRFKTIEEAGKVCDVELVKKCCAKRGVVSQAGRCYMWRYIRWDELRNYSPSERVSNFPGNIIRQYDEDGKLVREWYSPERASNKLDIPLWDINESCSDTDVRTLAGGFVFQSVRHDKFFSLSEAERRDRFTRGAVRQYTLTGEFVKEFATIKVASRETGYSIQFISRSCRSKSKHQTGHIFRYKADDELFELPESERIKLLVPYTIRQYDKEGALVADHVDMNSVLANVDTRSYSVIAVCRRETDNISTGGYIWRFSTDDELYDKSESERKKFISSLYKKVESPIRGWSAPESWRDTLPMYTEKEYTGEPQFRGIPSELQKWYKIIQQGKHGEAEQWAPAPLVNCKRKDGSWMYEVSDRGRVRRSDFVGWDDAYYESKLLQIQSRETLGPVVSLTDPDGNRHVVPIDHMVAIAFVGNDCKGEEVIHIDGDLANCVYTNLKWGSREEASVQHIIEEEVSAVTESVDCVVVRQYSPTHKLLETYNSVQEAAEAVDGDSFSITGACKNKCVYHRGFLWRYADDDEVQSLSSVSVEVNEEVWKPVSLVDAKLPTGAPKYEVSNYGRLRRPKYTSKRGVVYEEKIYSAKVDPSGMKKHNLRMADGSVVNYSIAFLVATAFVPNPNNLTRLQFIDGDLSNNRADNIIWSVAGYNRSIRSEHRVRQYSLDGKFIKEFDTVTVAAESVNGESSNIIKVCNQRYGNKSAYNYVWRYADNDEFDKGNSDAVPVLNDNERAVRQYSLDGVFIKEYTSGAKAAEAVGGTKTDIYTVCSGKTVTAKNFMWRYADDDDLEDNPATAAEIFAERKANRKPMERKLNPDFEVRQYSMDGQLVGTYQTSRKAADAMGYHRSGIRDVCARKMNSVNGFVWRIAKDDELFNLSVEARAELIASLKTKPKRRGKHIRQYDANKRLIKEFGSLTEASTSTGIDKGSIAECCDGERKSGMARGFIWRWADNDELYEEAMKMQSKREPVEWTLPSED